MNSLTREVKKLWNMDICYVLCMGLLLFNSLQVFLHQFLQVVFQWSLSDNKSTLVSRTLLSILADFNCAVVLIVTILPLISSSPSLFSRPLETIPRAPTTIGITSSLCSFREPFPGHHLQLVSPSSLCSFGDHSRSSNYNWYHHHLHALQLF